MKKTVIITIAMLVCFGIVLKIGAKGVADSWQKPRQDDVKPATSSPVDRVEQEYKEYRNIDLSTEDFSNIQDESLRLVYNTYKDYLTFYAAVQTDGMITLQQATNIAGTLMEKCGTRPLENNEIMIGLIQEPGHDTVYYSVGGYKNDAFCTLDPYTGRVLHVCGSDDYRNSTQVEITDENVETAIKSALEILKLGGYSDFEKYEVVECTNCVHEISAPHIGTIELVSDSRVASILVRSTDGIISISEITVDSDGEETRETIEHLKLSGKDIPQ